MPDIRLALEAETGSAVKNIRSLNEALGEVPKADRCQCREQAAAAKAAKKSGPSWLSRLLKG